jgi:hypothetical protein
MVEFDAKAVAAGGEIGGFKTFFAVNLQRAFPVRDLEVGIVDVMTF